MAFEAISLEFATDLMIAVCGDSEKPLALS